MDHECRQKAALERMEKDLREIRKDVKDLLKETSALNVKSTMWGAIGGMFPFLAGIILYFIGKQK